MNNIILKKGKKQILRLIRKLDRRIGWKILNDGPYKVQSFLIFIKPNAPMFGELVTGNGFHENLSTSLVQKFLKKGMTFVDVGANIGYFTLIAAKCVGTKGRVFSFEPELENFNLLCKNIKINCFTNVSPENLALSDLDGKSLLYKDPNSKGRHSICVSRDDWEPLACKTVRLDTYFKQKRFREAIDFIKIDAEGAELKVLRGMSNLIDPHTTNLLLEFSQKLIVESGENVSNFINFLIQIGYKKVKIIDEKEQNTYVFNISELNSLDENKTYNLFLATSDSN